jgi:glycosyltransferase involved in cell wall biosynthesis
MILFILPSFSGGGAERVSINILKNLYLKGRKVEIIVFDSDGPFSSMVPSGVVVHNLGTRYLSNSLLPLIFKLKLLKPDVIFSTFGYINIPLIVINKLFFIGAKVWAREANMPSVSLINNPHYRIIKFGYRWIYNYAERVLCTSEKMRNEFIRDFNIPKTKTYLLPNPIDEEYIRSFLIDTEINKRKKISFVAAGRLVHQKGFDRLLSWFSCIKNTNSNLIIFGDGPLKDDLQKTSEILKVSDRVIFMSFSDDFWRWVAMADVFLLPSRWEGLPNVVLEALACGTPVISTAESGGVLEITTRTHNRSITVVSTKEDFIEAMNNVCLNTTLSPRISLLPKYYRLDNAISIIEEWLDGC